MKTQGFLRLPVRPKGIDESIVVREEMITHDGWCRVKGQRQGCCVLPYAHCNHLSMHGMIKGTTSIRGHHEKPIMTEEEE